jgi:hypothetical protein
MITFFPCDDDHWRSCPEFDLTQRGNISLAVKTKRDYKVFQKRSELIEFLKEHGDVRLDDAHHPLEFTGPHVHVYYGILYDVRQRTLLGWMKEDYR